MTPQELRDQLKLLDEVTLMEILDLHADQLVDLCDEYITENHEQLSSKVEEPREAEDWEDRFARREELTGKLSWAAQDPTASDFDD